MVSVRADAGGYLHRESGQGAAPRMPSCGSRLSPHGAFQAFMLVSRHTIENRTHLTSGPMCCFALFPLAAAWSSAAKLVAAAAQVLTTLLPAIMCPRRQGGVTVDTSFWPRTGLLLGSAVQEHLLIISRRSSCMQTTTHPRISTVQTPASNSYLSFRRPAAHASCKALDMWSTVTCLTALISESLGLRM